MTIVEIVIASITALVSLGGVISIIAILVNQSKSIGRMEEKVCNLPCKDHESTIKKLEPIKSKMDAIPCDKHSDLFKQISEDIVQIKTFLMIKNPSAATAFSVKKSPRKLNDAGERLFEDISGKDFLEANKEFLLNEIEQKLPKTALDVETTASEVLFENLQNDIFNRLKNWVYNSPMRTLTINGEEKDYAVTIGDVCFVLSIPLRDMYLQNHPEISVE
ncbi:MAG: hypothetical protein ACI30B_01785 [Paludibacteraceae bacterium]